MTTAAAIARVKETILMNRALPYVILSGMAGCLVYSLTIAWMAGDLSLPYPVGLPPTE